MGQQQLLLVILVTIIVGIATVVALNVFGSQADEANRDAVRQDILSGAAQAQGYYIRPEMMDGGGYDFGDMTIDRLGIPGSPDGDGDDQWYNENGSYLLNSDAGGSNAFTLTGHPASAGGGAGTDGDGNPTFETVEADDQIEATIEVCDGGDDDGEVDIGWDGEDTCT